MSLLRELNKLSEATDLSELPHDVYHELEEHIHKGAKDIKKKYENALELVREAFKVENVEIPDPSMKKAWEQFSKLIHYATQKLAKFRGIDGDWRLNSQAFRESVDCNSYTVAILDSSNVISSYSVRDESIKSLTETIENFLESEFDVSIIENSNKVVLNLEKWNIKQKKSIIITS